MQLARLPPQEVMSLHVKTKDCGELTLILRYESMETEFINRLLPMLLRIKAAPELLQDPIRKVFETSICWLPGRPICEIRRMFKCEFRLSAICM